MKSIQVYSFIEFDIWELNVGKKHSMMQSKLSQFQHQDDYMHQM